MGPPDRAHAAAPLRIRLLGPFEVWVNGTPLPRLRSHKERWLLALLALRHGKEVERSWLAGTLWPDSPESQALATLRRSLTDLRRALGPEGKRLLAPTRRTIALDLAGAAADVLEFDAALARAGRTPREEDARASLEAAVELYSGPLLEGCPEEWILEERQAREEGYRAALERLAASALARGDAAAAAAYLRRVAALDPLHERARRALMPALAAEGSYAAAGEVYRELRLRLHRELNAGPAPETTALYEEIRGEARRRAAPPSPSPAPPSSLARSALPQALTPLVGRERERREIENYLAAARLVTLTGTGGVGKTRLALHVAEELAPGYVDGACWVELAALSDPTLVPQAVASLLGVREQAESPLPATLQESLKPKQLLLVLDNCEHLLEACARLAETLLRACPHLRILSTSRQSLGLTGEVAYRVPSLALPALVDGGWPMADGSEPRTEGSPPTSSTSSTPSTPFGPSTISRQRSAIAECDSVRLFVERAAAAAPGFALTEVTAPAVARVCRRLDGIHCPAAPAAGTP